MTNTGNGSSGNISSTNQYQQNMQRLYWSVARPLKWVGLTIDEWSVLLVGLIPGLFFINGNSGTNGLKLGLVFIIGGIAGCYGFKKFKNLSEHFLLKSYLLSKGLIPAPSKRYPHMLDQNLGK
jgi:hypothetical protein